jgi:hypothetical protein
MKSWRVIAIGVTAFMLAACAARATRQPHMEKALNLLQDAHRTLETASHDKGGHRVKAMEEIQIAIDEVNRGIEFDNTH